MEPVAEPALRFAGLLRQLRAEVRLTQEELAEAAGLSPRSVSDLERGINRTARKETALLLADALSLTGQVRVLFVAAARGRAPAAEVLAARHGAAAGAVTAATVRSLPRDVGSFTGREPELARLLADVAAGRGLVEIYAIDGMAGIGKTDPRCARRAPAGRQVPRRAVLPSAARPHPGPAAGQPGRRAGQLAADGRRRHAAHPARPGGPREPVA